MTPHYTPDFISTGYPLTTIHENGQIIPLLVKEGLGVVDRDATLPPTTPCPLEWWVGLL
jgi:hypothetical protein